MTNELENRAKKHKKKDKGLGWYMAVNPDKGNPKALEIFNNSTADGGTGEVASMGEDLNEDESVKESLHGKKRYVYDGPVYFDGKIDRTQFKKTTAAESPAKAINNIKWTLCNGNKLWYNRIDLDLDKLICLDNDVPNDTSMDEYDDTPHICAECGYKLNDAGECPLCDLGDYTALDEEISISEALFRLKD